MELIFGLPCLFPSSTSSKASPLHLADRLFNVGVKWVGRQRGRNEQEVIRFFTKDFREKERVKMDNILQLLLLRNY